MGKTKQPKVKEEPFPQKKPKIASNPLDYYHYHPSWRISKIQVIDPFGWHILDKNKLDEIESVGFYYSRSNEFIMVGSRSSSLSQ